LSTMSPALKVVGGQEAQCWLAELVIAGIICQPHRQNKTADPRMKVKRRIEITIEIDRVMILNGRGRAEEWCALCDRRVWMISAEEAAAFAHVSINTISGWIDLKLIHAKRSSDGRLVVCLDSLESAR
jgi:hypothetical protein